MRVVFCCIIDEADRFRKEYKQWVISHRLYSAKKIDIYAYFINSIPDNLSDFSHEYGVTTRTVQQLVPGSPHCNKLIPFLDEQLREDSDLIIVTDSDHHVVSDLSSFYKTDSIRLAPNNGNNPPLSKFKEIFKHFEVPAEVRSGHSLMPDENGSTLTYINNNSGGIIMIPSNKSKDIALKWKSNAMLLSEHKRILGRWSIHIDQIAFALTMEELGIDIDFLPAEANAVLKMIPQLTNIKAFHITQSHRQLFKHWFGPNGHLEIPISNEELQIAVSNYNRMIEAYLNSTMKYAS